MTQKEFYKSRAWVRTRAAFISHREAVDGGLCQICEQDRGLVVHHIIWLDDQSCNDPSVSLSFDNLRYECQVCHNQERDPRKAVPGRVRFDAAGNILQVDDDMTAPISKTDSPPG